jgi:hypothetical protein
MRESLTMRSVERGRGLPLAMAVLVVVISLVLIGPDRGGAQAVAARATPASWNAEALRLLSDLVHGDDRAVVATFNGQMTRMLSASRLAGDWNLYQRVFGRYLGHGRPVAVVRGTLSVIRIPLHMSKRPGEFRITFQPNGRVAGLYLLRTGVPL